MNKVSYCSDKQGDYYLFFCPGCETDHMVPVKYAPEYALQAGKIKPTWHFNGDLIKPTFKPDIRQIWCAGKDNILSICHFIIRDGEIIFLVDSTHQHSGARMKMEAYE